MPDEPHRILLVEDHDAIRNAFAILLEDSGYHVRQATTAAEAVKAAEDFRPHLILLDLGLPDDSGLNVARAIRANPDTRDSFVIAITGRATEADQAACVSAGCDDFLVKPVNASELLQKVADGL